MYVHTEMAIMHVYVNDTFSSLFSAFGKCKAGTCGSLGMLWNVFKIEKHRERWKVMKTQVVYIERLRGLQHRHIQIADKPDCCRCLSRLLCSFANFCGPAHDQWLRLRWLAFISPALISSSSGRYVHWRDASQVRSMMQGPYSDFSWLVKVHDVVCIAMQCCSGLTLKVLVSDTALFSFWLVSSLLIITWF